MGMYLLIGQWRDLRIVHHLDYVACLDWLIALVWSIFNFILCGLSCSQDGPIR